MTREFIMTQVFDKRWDELSLGDEDLQELQNHIMQNPDIGDIIQGTGGLTKLRWNLPNTGKSGGIRVLYINYISQKTIVLVNCYSKSEKDNISEKEKTEYKKIIKAIWKELK